MREPLLAIENLTKSYPRRGTGLVRSREIATIVNAVSFSINRGQTFGLVGESGSGKSTLGRMILQLIQPNAGRVLFDGEDLRTVGRARMKALRRRVQIVFQDPFSALDPRRRIGTVLSEPIRLHGLRYGREVEKRVRELLHLVGLSSEHAKRFPHEFSGGQRQRIAIARALAVEPELIVCDEPVSALDVSIQAQILNLFSDLQQRLSVSYLFIAHDMSVIRHLADSIGVLYAGNLVETGPADKIFRDPRHPYTRMLLAASPTPVPGDRRRPGAVTGEPPSPFEAPPGCPFASRCDFRIDVCTQKQPSLDAYVQADQRAACFRSHDLGAFDPASDDEALMSPAYRRRLALLREQTASASRS